jgi:hypothetical protein
MEHPARTLLYEFFVEPIVELLQRIVYGVSEVLMRDDMVQPRSLAARTTLHSGRAPAPALPIRKSVSTTTGVEKPQLV